MRAVEQVHEGSATFIRCLLSLGAPADSRSLDYGYTACHCAARLCDRELMSTLIDTFGVDVNATSKEGDTPPMFACANGAWDIVALLLAAGAKPHGSDALHAAVSAARTDTVDTLIATDVDLDTIDEHYWTACHYAVAQNNAELLDRLIAAGASVDVVDESLIHLAVIASLDGTLIQRLVAAGADVNATQGWERKNGVPCCHPFQQAGGAACADCCRRNV
jgi:ankyrin repeat protein